MKIKTSIAALVFATSLPMSAGAQNVLTGDTRLACEALMCLMAPTRPAECAQAITKYFSIRLRRFHQTLNARRNFLKLCPRQEASTVEQVLNNNPPPPDPPCMCEGPNNTNCTDAYGAICIPDPGYINRSE